MSNRNCRVVPTKRRQNGACVNWQIDVAYGFSDVLRNLSLSLIHCIKGILKIA